MGGIRTRSGEGRRNLLAFFAVFLLALNNAVPAGFMPVRHADGSVGLVICTGYGPLVLDGAHVPADHKSGREAPHDKPCPFAGHGAPATPAPAAFAPVAVETAAVLLHRGTEEGLVPGRGMAAPPPPSRGPPHLQA